jgi:hypothetical protein
MSRGAHGLRRRGLGPAVLVLVACLAQCDTPAPRAAAPKPPAATAAPAPGASAAEAWSVVYEVLPHPRCMNCHPAGDRPLQGDDSHPHAQDVRRGGSGHGLYAMRCATCHQDHNLDGPHLPPGAPNWHLPDPEMPLVFEGLGPGELCRRMRDPAHNGGRTPQQLLHHVEDDPLVLWGWSPGEGRTPVPVAHADLVRAMRTWIEGGCDCPP